MFRWGRFIPVTAAAEMVRVEVATPEPGVMEAGEKEQLKLLGIPAHEREIALLNAPDCGFAVTVKRPDCPAGNVTADGDAPKATVGGVAGGVGGAVLHAEL